MKTRLERRKGERGATLVEAAVAYLPLFLAFLGLLAPWPEKIASYPFRREIGVAPVKALRGIGYR